MNFIGIDPGASGSICWLSGSQVECAKMPPTAGGVWLLLAGLDPGACVLESVHATPQMGVTSAFKFGRGFGVLLGCLVASGLDVISVSPQKWQRSYGLLSSGRKIGHGDTEKKNRNKAKAQELFPEIKVVHWNADGLLLALYARTIYEAENGKK